MNKFLVDGLIEKGDQAVTLESQTEQHDVLMECSGSFVESQLSKNEFDMDKAKDIVMQTMKENDQRSKAENISKSAIVSSCSESHISESPTDKRDNLNTKEHSSRKSCVAGPDATKPLRKKAKLMRMERKAQKMSLANKLSVDVPRKNPPKNVQKDLDTLLNEVKGDSRHKLEVYLSLKCKISECLNEQQISFSGKTSTFRRIEWMY